MLVVENLKKNINTEEINYKYFYRLIKTSFEFVDFFGVEIERQDFKEGNLIKIEREKVDYLSTEKKVALDWLYKLYENEASPIHLIDIVGADSDINIEKYNLGEVFICN